MNPDSLSLIIAGLVGAFIGGFLTMLFMGVLAARMAQRVEKEAWRTANIFYARKPEI